MKWSRIVGGAAIVLLGVRSCYWGQSFVELGSWLPIPGGAALNEDGGFYSPFPH